MTQPPAPLAPPARTGNSAFATSVAILLLRLSLGFTFIYHGSQIAFGAFGGKGIQGMIETLAPQNLPGFLPVAAWAYLAAYGQLIGGISIFLGLLARLGAIPLIITMLVAINNVHASNGYSNQNQGYEYNLTLIAIAVAIILTGPGLISADAFLFRKGFWARGPQPLANPSKRPA